MLSVIFKLQENLDVWTGNVSIRNGQKIAIIIKKYRNIENKGELK